MSTASQSLRPRLRTSIRTTFCLAAGLAAVLLAGAFAAPAAQAATPVVSFDAYSQHGATMAPRPGLRVVPFQPSVDATAPLAQLGSMVQVNRPKDGTTGLFLAGPIDFSVNGTQADIQVAEVINETASATGQLTIDLVATTSPPPVGSFSGQLLSTFGIGTLPADSEKSVNSGEIAFNGASAGCYYLSLVLLESGNVVDVRTIPQGGTPQTNGYSLFGFGETCPAATSCTRTVNSVCLDSSRFQVTVVYDNTATGAGSGQVLEFGSTRAESNESGFYFFTDPSNFELGVKVLDACTINNAFWVFIGGLTNQGWSLNVLDTQTGRIKFYGNTDGVTTVTTTDTTALPCP